MVGGFQDNLLFCLVIVAAFFLNLPSRLLILWEVGLHQVMSIKLWVPKYELGLSNENV